MDNKDLNSGPLADRIRPTNLQDFVGQEHLVGKDKPIRRIIETGNLHSLVFWGPPGCGKTTLAKIIANETGAKFHFLSAVSAGKDDIRQIVNTTLRSPLFPQNEATLGKTSGVLRSESLGVERISRILFLDEIHRFNKAQQDYLLPYVEDGTLTLIGATTENPSFEIIPPLLSRCQVFVLNELSAKELSEIVGRGLRALTPKNSKIPKGPKEFLVSFANGDARQALNLLETTYKLYGKISINNLKNALQSKQLRYDKTGEEHYNTISAYIKSMRAGSVDAALYYLARMIVAGEDPLFIARRMVIFASEDIGMAQPTALVVANEVFRACETIGYPECEINLAHGTVYLATAKKDRKSYDALQAAISDVKKHGNLPIPLNLRNAPTKLMKQLNYGKNYQKCAKKDFLPEKLRNRKYFTP